MNASNTARRIVAHNLAAALKRERLADDDLRLHLTHDVGFARGRVAGVSWRGNEFTDPQRLFDRGAPLADEPEYLHYVLNTVEHLTITLDRDHARRDDFRRLHPSAADVVDVCQGLDPSAANLLLERLNVLGHNVHPLGRLRFGMRTDDALRYAAECRNLDDEPVGIQFVAARAGQLLRSVEPGHSHLDDTLLEHFPHLAQALARLGSPGEYSLIPLHPWQAENVLPEAFREELRSGSLVPLEVTLPATPTTSFRTLITEPGRWGRRWSVKTAVNLRLTSTRRDIAPATTVGSPIIAAAVADMVASDPWLYQRLTVIEETAGVCFSPPRPESDPDRLRGLSALLRTDIADAVPAGRLAITGACLTSASPISGASVLAELVARSARTRGIAEPAAAELFLRRYSELLTTCAIVLLSKYGVGIEGHLQNTVVVVDETGSPERLLLRDFGGVRLHLGRLAAAGYRLDLPPDSVTVAELTEVHRKAFYTCFQANLAEIVLALVSGHGLETAACWRVVLGHLSRALDYVRETDYAAANAGRDAAAVTAPTLPHRTFVRQMLRGAGADLYVPVPNPLHRAASSPTAPCRGDGH